MVLAETEVRHALDTNTSEAKGRIKDNRDRLTFVELFAGEGRLTQTLMHGGFVVELANDLETGGTDFLSDSDLGRLRTRLSELAKSRRLLVHLAPTVRDVFRREESFAQDEVEK